MSETVEPGALYVIATPIGNLKDITFRAIETLENVDVIAAEDTRHTRKLLDHYGISTACIAVHDHNERKISDSVLARLSAGESVALVSDAGTPLISDPGYYLVKSAQLQGTKVVPIPGASAAIAALSAAGLPSDRFCFEGFLPSKSVPRRSLLTSLLAETRTIIFYESPHRVSATLADMVQVFGGERHLVMAREVTKLFETIKGNNLQAMADWVQADLNQQKGEIVLLLHGADPATENKDQELDAILAVLLAENVSVKSAATIVAKLTGQKKNPIYQRALDMSQVARDKS